MNIYLANIPDRSLVANEGHTQDRSWGSIDGKVTPMIDHTEDIHYASFVTNDTWTTTSCIDICAVIIFFAISVMPMVSIITTRESNTYLYSYL
jgi:hypothetical protein